MLVCPPSRERSCRHRASLRCVPDVIPGTDVVGRRIYPGELSRFIIAGCDNPRVYSGTVQVPSIAPAEVDEKAMAQKRKKRKAFAPSQGQIAAVLSKALPRHVSASFSDRILHYQNSTDTPSLCVKNAIACNTKICKTTFVASIHFALVDTFGVGNVAVERCEYMGSDHDRTRIGSVPHVMEVVVLDAVLGRTTTHAKPLTSMGATVDKPVLMHTVDKTLTTEAHDGKFRAIVVVVPEAGVFYCHRERRKACVGVPNSLVPMDINWLRFAKNGCASKRFAANGYITRLWGGDADCVWKWKIHRRSPAFNIPALPHVPLSIRSLESSRGIAVYHLRQCADEDSPRLPPDFIAGADFSLTHTVEELRRAYLMEYVQSPSARRGCRHYVQQHLHRVIDPETVLVIDAAVEGDADLHISTHICHPKGRDKVSLFRDSIVQVRHLPALGEGAMSLLSDIRHHASSVRVTRGSSGVRGKHGDLGSMHPVGTRIERDKVNGPWKSRYKASSGAGEQPALAAAVQAAARLASTTVPAVLRAMQDMEDDADLVPVGGMLGDGGDGPGGGGLGGVGLGFARVSHTMDVSVDLSNASHYDVNDASQSFSIWTEDFPYTTSNWYFVLPNVYGKKSPNGRTYNGVAIKLTHGTLISWDGRLIRHCTSVMQRREGGHVYGTFFGAKSAVVHYGVHRAMTSERQRRAYLESHDFVQDDGGEVGRVVDFVPVLESKIIVDKDDLGLDGSLCSSDSLSDGWIGRLGDDLGLSDDEASVDEGIPIGDAAIDGDISDCGLWDEPEVAMWRISRRRAASGSEDGSDGDFESLSSPRPSGEYGDRLAPDVIAPRMGGSCVACKELCIDGGNMTSLRDALRFVCSGGPHRAVVDARECEHPNQVHQGNRPKLRPFCPYLRRSPMTGDEVKIRVYYPYFRVRNGEVGSLWDVVHPRKVSAFHLLRASHVLVPCPHLQFHFEELWKLLLPKFTTLRNGVEWIGDVPWYYIRVVTCRTKYPHILSCGVMYDTWVHVQPRDWDGFLRAIRGNVMVGVDGDCEADARMVAIESLTPATYLGGGSIYFPSEGLRDIFARKFEPYLPHGSQTDVGERESDGSPSRPHGLQHRGLMYYYMRKVCVVKAEPRQRQSWSREVTSGSLLKYDEDDQFFCYDVGSELYDERFCWYEHRFEAAKEVAPGFCWASLQNLSRALQRVLTLPTAQRLPSSSRGISGPLGQAVDGRGAAAVKTLIAALRDMMCFGLRFAMVFDRMCHSVRVSIPCLGENNELVRYLLSSFASMIMQHVPQVIPRYALACDDAFLLEMLGVEMVRNAPFCVRERSDIMSMFRDVMPRQVPPRRHVGSTQVRQSSSVVRQNDNVARVTRPLQSLVERRNDGTASATRQVQSSVERRNDDTAHT